MFRTHCLFFFFKSFSFFNIRQLYLYLITFLATSFTFKFFRLRFFFNFCLNYSISNFVCNIRDFLPLKFSRLRRLASQFRYYTVLRSPHVHKKARDQFSFRFSRGFMSVDICFFNDILFFISFFLRIVNNWIKRNRVNILIKSSLIFLIKI